MALMLALKDVQANLSKSLLEQVEALSASAIALAALRSKGFAMEQALASADAAHQIKAIITTNVAQVNDGAALVEETGSQIEQISHDIGRTVELIETTTSGTREQTDAIGEINGTISLLDEATQQNATLAEEISTSACSLVKQAETLEAAVAVFEVNR